MECFRTVWKVSGQSGKFPDNLEGFQTVWKVSRHSEKSPENLGNIWTNLRKIKTVWRSVSGKFEKFADSLFLDSLENLRTVTKVSGQYRKLLENQPTCLPKVRGSNRSP